MFFKWAVGLTLKRVSGRVAGVMKKITAGEETLKASKESDFSSGESDPIAKPPKLPLPPMADLGELPRTYGTDAIFLVAQEPHWLFTYWDIDIALHPGGKTFLRIFGANDLVEGEIEVPFETRNWYIPVGTAGAEYAVAIGYYRGAQWNEIARSVTVKTPRDKISESDDFDYATIPLHLSFQKLMENIRSTIQGGETLLQALGRLQRDGKLLAFGQGGGPGISPDERVVLEALLGKPLLAELSGAALSSGELSSRIQTHLKERLNSEGASELLARLPWGPSESSLFSALSAIASSSSWGPAALSSWTATALTSWAVAAQTSGGSGGLSGWPGIAQSSESSWNAPALSSWLQAATSSWTGAALSSWSQAALTSWSQAALSSWSHAETSSWGGSENIGSFGFAQREFFMHVNAEVIFYGGTHPQAKVTIDGKPVELAPDGSFRYHFVFPDGNYEIPITATSPDGVETRSATLRFERATARTGDVGHTAQPPLAVPMGATV